MVQTFEFRVIISYENIREDDYMFRDDVHEWLREHVGDDTAENWEYDWLSSDRKFSYFSFVEEKHAVLFKMTWG